MKRLVTYLMVLMIAAVATAQQVSVGGGYNGVPYIPNFTTTAQNAITPTPVGLLLFNSTQSRPAWYDGSQWVYDVGTQTQVALTVQAASIGSTALLTAPPPGLYLVCYNETITQAATTSSSILTTIGWTSGAAKTSTLGSLNGAAASAAADATNTLNSELAYCYSIRVGSGNITYATTYASSGGTVMQYSLNITASRLQ